MRWKCSQIMHQMARYVTQNAVVGLSQWVHNFSTSVLCINSGWLQMLGMIRQRMHFTQRSLVCQEGGGLLSCWCKYYKLLIQYPSTKRILACSTVSRKEHTTAQTRELQCTKEVLPQLLEQGNNTSLSSLCKYSDFCVHIRFQSGRSGTRPSNTGYEVHYRWFEAYQLLRHMAR